MEPLPKLSVIRGAYCSQEMTDRLVKYLQDSRPDLVHQLIEDEKNPFPDNRDSIFGKTLSKIENFLRNEEKEHRILTLSLTGMVDFIYELDRRVRKSLGLGDIPAVGKPIALGPEGPFPSLIDKPITITKQGKPPKGLTQEVADRATKEIYENNPEVIFAYCEHMRRLLRKGEPSAILANLFRTAVSDDDDVFSGYVAGELIGRLRVMCEIPGYEEIKKMKLREAGRS